MTKYEWKMASLAKGIDPNDAIKEIDRIENIFGSITPENVLKASHDKNSVLHPIFQWDDTKAAHSFRLQQARNLINNIDVRIISDGHERRVSVFEVVSTVEGRCYKSIQNMDSNDINYVKQQVRREISYLHKKLSAYKDMDATIKYLNDALNTL